MLRGLWTLQLRVASAKTTRAEKGDPRSTPSLALGIERNFAVTVHCGDGGLRGCVAMVVVRSCLTPTSSPLPLSMTGKCHEGVSETPLRCRSQMTGKCHEGLSENERGCRVSCPRRSALPRPTTTRLRASSARATLTGAGYTSFVCCKPRTVLSAAQARDINRRLQVGAQKARFPCDLGSKARDF